MSRHNRYIKLAINQAQQSTMTYRHGCVVVKGGRVLAKGFNSMRYSKVINNTLCSIHAEVAALLSYDNLTNATMYVVRINKNNKLMLSYPCKDCFSRISKAGIRKIVFSTDGNYAVIQLNLL